jgi:hypothetical protein
VCRLYLPPSSLSFCSHSSSLLLHLHHHHLPAVPSLCRYSSSSLSSSSSSLSPLLFSTHPSRPLAWHESQSSTHCRASSVIVAVRSLLLQPTVTPLFCIPDICCFGLCFLITFRLYLTLCELWYSSARSICIFTYTRLEFVRQSPLPIASALDCLAILTARSCETANSYLARNVYTQSSEPHNR